MGKGVIKSLVVIVAIAGMVLVFQNCGQSGFQSAELDSLGSSQNINSNVPFPIDFNVNQVGLMTCPKAGASPVSGDHMNNAFFNLRYGAYDNSTLTFAGATNQGGLKYRKEFVDFVKSTHGQASAELLTRTASQSGYLNGNRLAAGLIAVEGQRSRDWLAFTGLAAPLLDPLTSGAIVGEISETGRGFFSQASGNLRAMSGTLNFGQSEEDISNLMTELSNHYLFLGMTSDSVGSGAVDLITNLRSPTGDITQAIFAKGYKLQIAPKSSSGPAFIQDITEHDLSTSQVQDLTTSQNQNWACMTLKVVRDIDRKYATNGAQLIHKTEVYNSFGSLVWHEFKSPAELNSIETQMTSMGKGDVRGTHQLCPSQSLASLDNPQYKERLKIIRRFLPADLWEVNSELLCAVPNPKAIDEKQKCYASGDDDPKYYIQYNMTNCGPGQRECPAAVSICTRVD